MKRRAAIHIISAIAAGTAIPPGAIETLFSGLDDSLGRPLGLSEWEATVHEYGQVVGTLPAGELIKDLIADIVAVGELLNRPNSTDDRAALMRVNAGLAGVLAVDFGDVGEKRAARMSWAAARQSADASGDRDLRVWVRGKAAQKAFWTERPDSVVAELASEAIGIADGTPSAGLADAYAARVYVAAARGDTDRVDSTLDDLRRVFDHLPQDTNDQSALAFRESQLRWAESYARTWNADPRAEVSLEHALSLYPSNAFAPRTNLALMKAAVMINDREIEAGLQHAITTMENDYRRCAGRAQLVKRVLHTLPGNARTLPAARELHAFTTAT
ncbi:XRE family transcriptional regulator [Actinomadura graeca]|uniref:XRE family transcriptional regulator n=1 Tax=Actinomadura graeca TaxID=2750812 RepID=A0ABX8R8Q3_9ACTN|nr:XRE family transcriptional regulator [Actinomadura graeca]